MSRRAIHAGKIELASELNPQKDVPGKQARVRREGGGRKKATEKQPGLREALLELVEPSTHGDPENPLRWTSKSVRKLAAELKAKGFSASHQLVSELLAAEGYSLQANAKVREGGSHPDRDGQFRHINDRIRENQANSQPVISVDTKKKELVGDFKNAGREYHPKGSPEEVRVHDFLIPELGRANPYGVYDLENNQGWVCVGTDHDTAAFAVSTIRRWWESMGAQRIPVRNAFKSQRTEGGAMVQGIGFGKGSCKSFPTKRAWSSKSPICHPGQANGTR